MNRLALSIVLVFSIAFALYLSTWLEQDEQVIVNDQNTALIPNYEASNMRTRLFNKAGKLAHEVEATEMQHFDELGFVTFSEPTYRIHIEQQNTPWILSAFEGTLYNNKRIQLEQNVSIVNQQADSFVSTINTSFIEINLDTNLVFSDQAVQIIGPDYVVQSMGFNANLDTQQYELSQHVQTEYSPQR